MGKAKAKAKEAASKARAVSSGRSPLWLLALLVPAVAWLTRGAWTAPREEAAAAEPSPEVDPVVKAEADGQDLRWTPRTLSVVLPCAGEGLFAKKTVKSVADSVPGGIGGGILEDIVVVDDGSSPPLSQELTEKFRKRYPLKLVRHESAVGLMGAKSAGAREALGDVIVFFDCHVAPQEDWYQKFLDGIKVNYRRIVVPVITNLDIDTWKETERNQGMAKCYLTWDADFKWVESSEPYMPVLSGGLLGISRRWWNETGGYDEGMAGWGGENVDQSLRAWLCGGEIVSLSNAFVAHMWRRKEDPRTSQNYEVSQLDAIRNKARAVLAWFDEYREKAAEYPAMAYVGLLGEGEVGLNRDVRNFGEVKDRLQCRPFAWFLWRFRDIYVEGGLLPPEVFRLREVKTNSCLTFLGPMGTHPQGRGTAALLPCDMDFTTFRGLHPQAQKWHARNRDPSTGKCCSAIGSWNTDQCLLHQSQEQEGLLSTVVCDVSGKQVPNWSFWPDTGGDTGKLSFGGSQARCLVADTEAGQSNLGGKGSQLMAWKMKFVKCKKSTWQKIDVALPIETRLYREALERHAEIFK